MSKASLLATALSITLPANLVFAESFDWSGRSDVYLQQLYGATSEDLATNAASQPYQSTSLGWAYKITDSGLFVDGFVRAREMSELEVAPNQVGARMQLLGTGYGLGLGWKRDLWHIEIGGLEDDFAVRSMNGSGIAPKPDGSDTKELYSQTGGYMNVGVDLIHWRHLLIQANAQVEALQGRGQSQTSSYLPEKQYIASAGLSLHANEINSVIPSAVVVTALIVAACAKGCNLGGNWFGGSSCSDKDDKECHSSKR